MNKFARTAALTAAAALALAGCSQAGAASNAGTGGKEKIGIALPAGNQTFWTGWQNAARAVLMLIMARLRPGYFRGETIRRDTPALVVPE